MIGPVYFVTDPDAGLSVIEQARAAAHGGAWAVQLRDKHASDADFLATARTLCDVLYPLGVRVFVNDRIHVAQALGTDLHIGQGDGDVRQARQAIASQALLGLSIETQAQCAAIPDGVDYIGAGPVYQTGTKPDAAAPIGLTGLQAIAEASPVPTIAIGGLSSHDIPALKRTGVAGLAVVTAISRAQDPEAATRALLSHWQGG